MPRSAERLPDKMLKDFKGVELILHAGDITEGPVLAELEALAPVKAVCGNMDSMALRKILPKKKLIKIGRFKIGLIHGYGPPHSIVEKIRMEFDSVDAIVFGHSHSPLCKIEDNILFFNPGSPTDKIFARENSYGILTINDAIKGEIKKL